jgi:drug/metabolite transporter (DMT)-like permease
MPVAALWPFVLAIVAYSSYQLVLKLVRPDVHILAVLAFAYLVSCATAVTLWLMNPGLGDNRLQGRDMMMAALIGVSIVGIEFGFASAFRAGQPINTTGAIVNVATALLVVPIGYAVFGEQMSGVKLAGLALCCGGLMLLAWK